MAGTISSNDVPVQLSQHFERGSVLDHRYEVIKRLSDGSERGIYLCHHLAIPDQRVVLKVLHRPRTGEDIKTTAERFEREVLAAKSIAHPNVVSVYDFIRHGSFLAYTMEYVSGGNLASLVGRQPPAAAAHIVEVLAQLCAGVAAINRAGIIHRELKPDNILLTPEGQVKISDFGVAKIRSQPTLTVPGALLGTIDYLSPEYVMEGAINDAVDVYSIGIIAYELLTGQIPYQSDDIMDCLQRRINNEPIDVREYNPQCPDGLAAIVSRALRRNPAQRYQNSLEMLYDLAQLGIGPRAAEIARGAGLNVVTNYSLGGTSQFPGPAVLCADGDSSEGHADSFLELELLKASHQRPKKKLMTPLAESLLAILIVTLVFYAIGYHLFVK